MEAKQKYIRIGILMLVDIVIVTISSILPLALRFGIFTMNSIYLTSAIYCLPVDIAVTIMIMAVFRLYNRVWTYAGIDEVVATFKASLIIEAIYVIYRLFLDMTMPRSFFVFNWIFLFLLLAASRVSIRLTHLVLRKYHRSEHGHRILIVGAGAASLLLMRELIGQGNVKIACLIDDNPNKKGKYIQGVPIVGNRSDIPCMVDKYGVDTIIIAIPSAPPRQIRDIISICNSTGANLKILPSIASTLTSSFSNALREVNYEDLLSREAVVINNRKIEEFVREKTILVTGGGGTIGSELCRQLVANMPKKLILFDIYENGAYEVQMELQRNFPQVDVEVLIGSVRDYNRLDMIFKTYRPQVVYHAAAHKHVPLMEYSPNEAIKNNCMGTFNLVKLSNLYKTERFILISTDKAVRPTNVMGATKRICEMIIQSYNALSETEFAAVRFGNVLGSNGSVIPLFLKQIEAGGPVTVTHREITRFFMTVSEAVSLVLQAGLLAKGGEIFVLDMGQPVKIYDLAENLIRLKGYTPGEDIQIKIVGLRPGEKLYEELLMDEEGLESTPNELIFIGKPIVMDYKKFLRQLNRLIHVAEKNSNDIKMEVAKVCDTYVRQEEK